MVYNTVDPSMEMTSIERLAKAIEYPEEVPSGTAAYSFSVDDGMVEAVESNGRLVLSRALAAAADVDLARFLNYAAGRVLREEAVLAYDPAADQIILWQDLPVRDDADLLRRFFEVFAASCDWWLARVHDVSTASTIPDMMIRP